MKLPIHTKFKKVSSDTWRSLEFFTPPTPPRRYAAHNLDAFPDLSMARGGPSALCLKSSFNVRKEKG
jgi:hypothetical protein